MSFPLFYTDCNPQPKEKKKKDSDIFAGGIPPDMKLGKLLILSR